MRRNRVLLYPSTVIILLTAYLLPLLCTVPSHSAEENGFGAHLSKVEQHYKKTKDYYYQLRRDENIRDNRLNWIKGAREFRQIYLNDPKGELAPNCLFMLGTMHYRMYLGFRFQEDIDEAITYYQDVWLLFPDNSLADDALYWAAEIYRKEKNNPNQAAQLLSKQIKRYPDGDKYAQALNRLREIDDKNEISGKGTLAPPAADTTLTKVLPVQYWSSDDYTRIVIRSSGPVNYTSQLLEKKEGQPRKLLLDFSHSSIDSKYTSPVPVGEGLLLKIQSGPLNSKTVRIALDIESISTYKIFSLSDPFRVIVDIHGQQKVLSASKSVPQVQREQVFPPAKNNQPVPVAKKNPPPKPPENEAFSAQSQEEDPFVVFSDRKKRKPAAEVTEKMETVANGLTLAQQLGLGVRRIILDPGHGGKDPGAMGNGLKEKDITLNVARRTATALRNRYGYEVILTRENDRSLPLEERTAIANTKKADLFVSIHVNAHPNKSTRGVETYYLNLATNTEAMRVAALENATSTLNISDLQDILTDLMQNSKIQESSVLAQYVQNRLVSGLRENSFPTTDLGVKQAPFYVLIGAEMPSVLAEISFLSNPQDAKRLRQEVYLDEIAQQIAAGIAGYADHQATAALQL